MPTEPQLTKSKSSLSLSYEFFNGTEDAVLIPEKQEETVRDADSGKTIPLSKAIRIDGHWFEKDVTAVMVKEYAASGYYPLHKGAVFFDHRYNEWRSSNHCNLEKGVYDIGEPLNIAGLKIGTFITTDNYTRESGLTPVAIPDPVHWKGEVKGAVKYFMTLELMLKYFDVKSLDELILYNKCYYHVSSPHIFKCELTDRWCSVANKVIFIKEIKADGGWIEGYADFIATSEMIYVKNVNTYFKSREQAESLGYKEDIFDGNYKKAEDIMGIKGKGKPFPLPAIWEGKEVTSKTFEQTEGLKLTYGIEVESSLGLVPGNLGLPMWAEKDGSLRDERGDIISMEYITVPMQGDEGFKWVKKIGKELTKRCEINHKCSLHVHIGGFEMDRLFVISLYQLSLKIQDEIFGMLPRSRSKFDYSERFPIKKQYCAKLSPQFAQTKIKSLYKPKDKEDYDKALEYCNKKLLKFLLSNDQGIVITDDIIKKYNGNNRQHLVGMKWNRLARYFWINFYNTKFGDIKTIEIRSHSGTLNHRKITNWIKICMATVEYARKQSEYCLDPNYKINLSDVIRYAYPKTGDELVRYIRLRKDKFALPDVSEETLEEHEYAEDENEPESLEEVRESVKKIKLKPIEERKIYERKVLITIRDNGEKVYETILEDEDGVRVTTPVNIDKVIKEPRPKAVKRKSTTLNWATNYDPDAFDIAYPKITAESLYDQLIKSHRTWIGKPQPDTLVVPNKRSRKVEEHVVEEKPLPW